MAHLKQYVKKQYVNKSDLVEEIKRRLKVHMESNHGFSARYDELKDILSFLDTLETKEVNLEKEIHNYLDNHNLNIQDGGRIVFANGDTPNFMCDFRDIAKHFYELGLKAQKGE